MIFISINLKFYRPPLKYSLFLTSRSTDEKYPTSDIVINNLSIHFYFESIFLFHFYTTCKPPIQSFFKHRILGQANKFFFKCCFPFVCLSFSYHEICVGDFVQVGASLSVGELADADTVGGVELLHEEATARLHHLG